MYKNLPKTPPAKREYRFKTDRPKTLEREYVTTQVYRYHKKVKPGQKHWRAEIKKVMVKKRRAELIRRMFEMNNQDFVDACQDNHLSLWEIMNLKDKYYVPQTEEHLEHPAEDENKDWYDKYVREMAECYDTPLQAVHTERRMIHIGNRQFDYVDEPVTPPNNFEEWYS